MTEILSSEPPDPLEEKIARDTLERYSGSSVKEFQPYLLLTNFPKYVHYFAKKRGIKIFEGAMYKVAHSKEEKISILDFKIGTTSAALVIDLCANLPIKAALQLGMCAGLRKHYRIGDYFLPVAGIRGEGTSDFYFPKEVPAMANFLVQKVLADVMEENKEKYHIGITHTTNKRFWEFNERFKDKLRRTRPQALELECATLFMSSYFHKFPLGALLLISDLPLSKQGIKTKQIAETVYENYTAKHVEYGVEALDLLDKALKKQVKGVFRGSRRRFAKQFPEEKKDNKS